MRDVDIWLVIGFGGQLLFFGRFLVQWIVSERIGKSVIPISFWFFSLGGAVVLLVYSIHRMDPVFIAGQSMGLVIYTRNLMLLRNEHSATGDKSGG